MVLAAATPGVNASVTAPVTVIAGDADEIVPPEHSQAVAAAASYIDVAGARHNDPELSYGPLVIDAVVRSIR